MCSRSLTSRVATAAGERGAVHIIVAGSFAVPGLLIALAVVFMALRVPGLDFLYLTFPLLIFAYVVHFGVQALRSAEVGVATVDRRLEEAAQTLGAGRLRRLLRIEVPLMLPALAAGGGLVMLSTMKEPTGDPARRSDRLRDARDADLERERRTASSQTPGSRAWS